MQNRDTGEMDVIHIYELDPVPEVDGVKVERTNDEDSGTAATTETDSTAETSTVSTAHGDEADVEGAQGIPAVRTSYLAIAQRKLELGTRPFLHPYAQCSFGIPLLIRVADLEGYTGRDLYDLVAGRVEKYTPKIIHPILHRGTKLASNDGLVHVDEGTDGGSPSRGRNPRGRHHRRQTTADMEDASAGKMPRYGFRLRLASRDGRRCAICQWYESCIGCHIPDDDSPTIVSCGDSIAIDWHLALDLKSEGFGWNISEASHTIPGQLSNGSNNILSGVKNHRTCSTGKGKYGNGAITLEECLDAFSKQEKVPDAYCSKCNDLRDQSKEMTLWRLPPVIIIHLKRFQWGELRRKLRDHVEFPTVGLDFSRIIAGAHGENDIESDADGSIKDTKDDAAMNGHGETPAEPTEDNKDVEADAKSDPHSDANNNNTNAKEGAESSASTNDLANQMKSLHVSPGSESLYDLYGVVHHQGTSSTGHYVATLKSESDGKWRLFNDAQIFEVNERDVVDSSAYILFYIRRDVKKAFSMHTVFTGNPGTGKTTVARILVKIYKALGILERGHLVECDRKNLVAGYTGQTAIKTSEMIDKALGGGLFIDEAYSLTQGGQGDFGREAVDTLLKRMEDERGEFIVIAAGYPNEMRQFLEINPGLLSRFDRTLNFPDYDAKELMEIAEVMFDAENLFLDIDSKAHLNKYIHRMLEHKHKYFGNARSVRKVVKEIARRQNLRLAEMPANKRTADLMRLITLEDFKDFKLIEQGENEELPRKGIGFR